jgi:glycosyltransferase involved in cell wall biosynthesis
VPTTPLSIGFISQDWSQVQNLSFPNGCTWYRCILPAMAMIRRNHACQIGTISVADGKVGVRVRAPLYKTEGIYSGHKMLVFKLPMHAANLIAVQIAKANKVRVVVDIDDWFDNLPETNRARQQTDPELHKDNNRDIYFQVIEMADALICSTPFLYDFYSKKHPTKPVFMVRNSIDIGRWPKRNTRRSVPVIGWVGATPWRSRDLEQLSSFFKEYLISQNTTFHHSGHIAAADSAASLLGIDDKQVSTTPMLPMTQLPELYKNIDIGIVPLNNVEFNHAKSYLKGLEYAAAGIPFVASHTPEYQYLADAGVGRIAKTDEEWIAHFNELMDYNMRVDESELNKEIITEHFSIDSFASQWEHVYTSIMDIT